MIIPLDLTQLSCPGLTLAAGLPSGFTSNGVGCLGGALWRACNLTSFSPCLTSPVDYPFASHHKGPGFKSPGGYLFETGILLLALSPATLVWRACNLTSFSPFLTGPVDYLFASPHKGPRFKSPGGYLCETKILLLALPRYIGLFHKNRHFALMKNK